MLRYLDSSCLNSNCTRTKKRCQQGVTSLEVALLLPFIFILLLFCFQVAFILVGYNITQYAAFMAARSHMVYGQARLGEITYPYTASSLGVGSNGGLLTDSQQSIAEAVAEKIIFETLPWEHHRITVANEADWYMERLYSDGIDEGTTVNRGSVRIEFGTHPYLPSGFPGVRVTYCMPSLFPAIDKFVTALGPENELKSCRVSRSESGSGEPPGIPISYGYYLGREP